MNTILEKEPHVSLTHTFTGTLQTTPGIDMNALIGVPHLFGRYHETREGFMIVPIGNNMTLQADGRVTGYSNPNENTWIPYIHGTVSSGEAFAFMCKFNNWIPSSTWQQTIAGMPVGFFCLEHDRPQKLCLVPNTPAAKKTEVIYLVASCLRFYKQTLPKLLEDLFAEGIEAERIKVVVNGCRKMKTRSSMAFHTPLAGTMPGSTAPCTKHRCAGHSIMQCSCTILIKFIPASEEK